MMAHVKFRHKGIQVLLGQRDQKQTGPQAGLIEPDKWGQMDGWMGKMWIDGWMDGILPHNLRDFKAVNFLRQGLKCGL